MANPNRMQNPSLMTSQPQPMHHPQYSQMMQSQTMNTTPVSQTQSQATGSAGLTLQMPTQSHVSPNKDISTLPIINNVSLCRMGQETVQEIVARLNEIFQAQKQLSTLPNGVSQNLPIYQERSKAKLEECLNQTAQQMRNLKLIYNKVVQSCGGPGQIDVSCIPYEDEPQKKVTHSREYQYVNDELREVSEQVRLKNHQLKEIIDKLRCIVWEINTMMAMRYT